MGFEIVFKYHEKNENGYDTTEQKTFKKKCGDAYEDVPLEKLALSIMGQLARRDIWIVDVEISEFVKKSISFRETKGGIVIKNKKFSLDNKLESSVIVEECTNETIHIRGNQVSENKNHSLSSGNGRPVYPHELISRDLTKKKPVTQMIFAPEPQQIQEISKYKLTIDKKYPIYEKKLNPTGGELFLIVDDLQREISISDKYFVPATINLIGDDEFANQQASYVGAGKKEPKLSWNGVVSDDVPHIR